MKKTFANIKAGDELIVDAMGEGQMTFLGFTRITEKYSDKPVFDTLSAAKRFYRVSSAAQLEHVGDHLEYGHKVYACFEELDTEKQTTTHWQAYLFNGKWCCGSSAVPVRIIRPAWPA